MPDGCCQPGRRIPLPAFADLHVRACCAFVGEEGGRSVALVPDQPGGAAAKMPESLPGRRHEHRLGRFALRDESARTVAATATPP